MSLLTYNMLELIRAHVDAILQDEVVAWSSSALEWLVGLEIEVEELGESDLLGIDDQSRLEVASVHAARICVVCRVRLVLFRIEAKLMALGTNDHGDGWIVARLHSSASSSDSRKLMALHHGELVFSYTIPIEENSSRQIATI